LACTTPGETDVDDQDLTTCNFNKERCDYLHEVSVIFWDEFIPNDCILMEAVLEEFKTRWDRPRDFSVTILCSNNESVDTWNAIAQGINAIAQGMNSSEEHILWSKDSFFEVDDINGHLRKC